MRLTSLALRTATVLLAAMLAHLFAVKTEVAAQTPTHERIGMVGDWEIHYAQTPSGAAFCGAARFFPDLNAWLHLDRVSNNRSLQLTFYGDGAPKLWKERPIAVDVRFRVSRRSRSVSARGAAMATSKFDGVGLFMSSEMERLIRAGSAISFAYQGFESAPMSLSGSSKALTAVKRCIEERFE